MACLRSTQFMKQIIDGCVNKATRSKHLPKATLSPPCPTIGKSPQGDRPNSGGIVARITAFQSTGSTRKTCRHCPSNKSNLSSLVANKWPQTQPALSTPSSTISNRVTVSLPTPSIAHCPSSESLSARVTNGNMGVFSAFRLLGRTFPQEIPENSVAEQQPAPISYGFLSFGTDNLLTV